MVLSIALSGFVSGQLRLSNASFEDTPRDATTPIGWNSCGAYSTPDILPGYWEVTHQPVEGKTFLGLITRGDGTNEWIGQKISGVMEKNECYFFTVSLARSTTYANYNNPVILKIWGGTKLCEKRQLLAQTHPIAHEEWMEYEFVLIPKLNYEYLIIEAFFTKDSSLPYKGNLLIDACSTIEKCDRVSIENDDISIHN